MRPQWPIKSISLGGLFLVPSAEKIIAFKNSVYRTGADCDDIGVDHHVGQPSIPLIRMMSPKLQDSLDFPVSEPEVFRDFAVVLVGIAIAFLPVGEFAAGNSNPVRDPSLWDLSSTGPIADEIDYVVPCLMGDPSIFQLSPRLFFSVTCSCMSSESTSFF